MINLFNLTSKTSSEHLPIEYIEKSEEQRIREFGNACETLRAVDRAITQIVNDSNLKADMLSIIKINWHDPASLKTEIGSRLEEYTLYIEGFSEFHPDAKLYVQHEAAKQLLSKFTVEVKAID